MLWWQSCMMESCGITQILCLNLNSVPCPLWNPGQVTKSLPLNFKPPHPFDDFSLIKEIRVLHEDIGKQLAHNKGELAFLLCSEHGNLKKHLQKEGKK